MVTFPYLKVNSEDENDGDNNSDSFSRFKRQEEGWENDNHLKYTRDDQVVDVVKRFSLQC